MGKHKAKRRRTQLNKRERTPGISVRWVGKVRLGVQVRRCVFVSIDNTSYAVASSEDDSTGSTRPRNALTWICARNGNKLQDVVRYTAWDGNVNEFGAMGGMAAYEVCSAQTSTVGREHGGDGDGDEDAEDEDEDEGDDHDDGDGAHDDDGEQRDDEDDGDDKDDDKWDAAPYDMKHKVGRCDQKQAPLSAPQESSDVHEKSIAHEGEERAWVRSHEHRILLAHRTGAGTELTELDAMGTTLRSTPPIAVTFEDGSSPLVVDVTRRVVCIFGQRDHSQGVVVFNLDTLAEMGWVRTRQRHVTPGRVDGNFANRTVDGLLMRWTRRSIYAVALDSLLQFLGDGVTKSSVPRESKFSIDGVKCVQMKGRNSQGSGIPCAMGKNLFLTPVFNAYHNKCGLHLYDSQLDFLTDTMVAERASIDCVCTNDRGLICVSTRPYLRTESVLRFGVVRRVLKGDFDRVMPVGVARWSPCLRQAAQFIMLCFAFEPTSVWSWLPYELVVFILSSCFLQEFEVWDLSSSAELERLRFSIDGLDWTFDE